MVSFGAILVSAAVYIFVFRKLSNWAWFLQLKKYWPRVGRELWDSWIECPFCGGFWVALGVRALTSLTTISWETPLFERTLMMTSVFWLLEAMTTAVGVLFLVRFLEYLVSQTRS